MAGFTTFRAVNRTVRGLPHLPDRHHSLLPADVVNY